MGFISDKPDALLMDADVFSKADELAVLNTGDGNDPFAQIAHILLGNIVSRTGALGVVDMASEPGKTGLTVFNQLFHFSPDAQIQTAQVNGRHQNNCIEWKAPIIEQIPGSSGMSLAGAADTHKRGNLGGDDLLGAKFLPSVTIRPRPDDFPHVLEVIQQTRAAGLFVFVLPLTTTLNAGHLDLEGAVGGVVHARPCASVPD